LNVALQPAKTLPSAEDHTVNTRKTLGEGQRAYEEKRAAKNGMSLEKWLASKQRQAEEEAREREKVAAGTKPPRKPGFLARLVERAQRPLGSKPH
jgi:sRNA-binding protein